MKKIILLFLMSGTITAGDARTLQIINTLNQTFEVSIPLEDIRVILEPGDTTTLTPALCPVKYKVKIISEPKIPYSNTVKWYEMPCGMETLATSIVLKRMIGTQTFTLEENQSLTKWEQRGYTLPTL